MAPDPWEPEKRRIARQPWEAAPVARLEAQALPRGGSKEGREDPEAMDLIRFRMHEDAFALIILRSFLDRNSMHSDWSSILSN